MCELLSHVWLFVTLWTGACQAPLSMDFPRQEYWSGLPFPSSADLPHPGIEPRSPTLQIDSLPSSLSAELPGKPLFLFHIYWSRGIYQGIILMVVNICNMKFTSLSVQFSTVDYLHLVVWLMFRSLFIFQNWNSPPIKQLPSPPSPSPW